MALSLNELDLEDIAWRIVTGFDIHFGAERVFEALRDFRIERSFHLAVGAELGSSDGDFVWQADGD